MCGWGRRGEVGIGRGISKNLVRREGDREVNSYLYFVIEKCRFFLCCLDFWFS